jgi:thiol-disulfide isomerase/thioredoxin
MKILLITIALLFCTTSVQAEDFIIRFTATWCGPCKTMEARMRNSDDVQNSLKDYKVYVIDIDQHKKLSNGWKIRSLPTIVRGVIDKEGNVKETGRLIGSQSNKKILEFLKNTYSIF